VEFRIAIKRNHLGILPNVLFYQDRKPKVLGLNVGNKSVKSLKISWLTERNQLAISGAKP